jgi:hypothetical protein
MKRKSYFNIEFVSINMLSNEERKDEHGVHGRNHTMCSSKGSKRLVLRITGIWWISRLCKENVGIKSAIVLQCLRENTPSCLWVVYVGKTNISIMIRLQNIIL